jgi:hypothetical protein
MRARRPSLTGLGREDPASSGHLWLDESALLRD